jgi:hypothetical protein
MDVELKGENNVRKMSIKFRKHTEIKMKPKEFVKIIAPRVGKEYPFEDVKKFRAQGYLNEEQFLILGYSKTTRQWKNYIKNNPKEIENITRAAFKKNDLDSMVKKLQELDGVGVPVASYILTAWNPKDYGTYDSRMKDILPECEDFVEPKNKSDLEWYKAELELLRKWRDELGIKTCRQVELSLWRFQQMIADIPIKK